MARVPSSRVPTFSIPGHWAGLVSPGNIDLAHRPVVHNPDGSISTVLSTSFTDPRSGHEVLVPQVVGGRVVSPRAAWANYLRTGQNLGTFVSPAAADRYAQALHLAQANMYAPPSPSYQQPRSPSTGGLQHWLAGQPVAGYDPWGKGVLGPPYDPYSPPPSPGGLNPAVKQFLDKIL